MLIVVKKLKKHNKENTLIEGLLLSLTLLIKNNNSLTLPGL